MKKFLLLIFILSVHILFAQQSSKLSTAFKYVLNNPLNIENDATYPALFKSCFGKALNKHTNQIEDGLFCIIRTTNAKTLENKDIQIHSVLPNFATAWVAYNQIQTLIDDNNVSFIDVPKIVFPTNDLGIANAGANLLYAGKLNNTAYLGDGVLVGVFDTGIDWDHLDFRSPTDTTKSRILRIWDQTITPIAGENSPSGFNYGVEYTQAHLNNELDGTPTNYVRERDYNGHGTHVAGTCAGNGIALASRKNAGVAPNADLIIVKGGDGSFSSTNEINAMTYFRNVATSLGKPIIVNMSIGGQSGAHDGTNDDEIAVDNFCTSGNGRVVCISAGNDNGSAIHRQVNITAGSSGNYVINVPTASASTSTDVFQISIYSQNTNNANAIVTLPDNSTITANAGQSISPTILSGAARAYLDNYIDPESGDRLINLYVVRSSTTANPSGTYTITISNTSASTTRFDGWLNYKGTNFGATSLTSGDNNYLVGSPGNATNAITVASFVGRLDWFTTSTSGSGGVAYNSPAQQDAISTFSSRGPRRDDVQKPNIAASGQAVVSCLSSDAGLSTSSTFITNQGLYRANQGTSMSSPMTAGCVALMLQVKPNATFSEIRNAIQNTATKDAFTGNIPNFIFGYGKIDVFKAASNISTCTTFKRETYSYDSSSNNTNGNATQSNTISANNKVAVRFTPTITGKLGGVYLRHGSTIPTNNFTIEVRSSDGSNPSTLLGSININPNFINRYSWNYYDISSLNIATTNGVDYFICATSTDSWSMGFENLLNNNRSRLFNGTSWSSFANDYRIRSVVYNNDIPTSSSVTNITACNNYLWNGTTYTVSGTYTTTGLINSKGCDSVATLNLTINNSTSSTTIISACGSYVWNGTSYNTSGTYTTTGLINSKGCDSVATLNLTINKSTSSTTTISTCDSYVWNGSICNTTGIYVKTLTNGNSKGCDSIATLNLTIKPNFIISATSGSNGSISNLGNTTICEGNSLTYTIVPNSGYFISDVVVNGISIGAVSSYTFNNVVSNHTISASFNSICVSNSSTTSITACNSYFWNGINYTSSGTYQKTGLTNLGGCDSTAILILTINQSSTSLSTISLCTQQLPYTWNGLTFSAFGTQTVTFINAKGCDSFASLTINPSNTIPSIIGSNGLCNGSTISLSNIIQGGIWTAGSVHVSVNTSGLVTANAAGNTFVNYTINTGSCKGTISKPLTVFANPSTPNISAVSGQNPFIGAPSGSWCRNRTLTVGGSPGGGTWSSTGAVTINSFGVLQTGPGTGLSSFTYTFTNSNACSSRRTFSFNVVACATRTNADNNFSISNTFTLYPNPAKGGSFIIKSNNPLLNEKLEIFDILGKILFTTTMTAPTLTINNHLPKGLYFVKLSGNVEKLIVD